MTDQPHDMEAIIKRIQKLAAVTTDRGASENEASFAASKMAELLEAYNLDMSVIGKTGKGAQRKDTQKKGGLYSWQRKLWQNVAELNFCYYLSIKGLSKGSTYEHRLVGSHANVISTEIMATYLQQTVEKLAQAWANEHGYKSVFVREAIAYREGMAERISRKLQVRRNDILQEERKREEERKQEEARTGIVTGTELVLSNVISTEQDFNNDYLNGWDLGTTAQHRHERDAKQKQWQAEHEEQQKRWEQWCKDNPDEAAKKKAAAALENKLWWEKYTMKNKRRDARRAAREERGYVGRERAPTAEEQRRQLHSYHTGYDHGERVGIDTQVDKTKQERLA